MMLSSSSRVSRDTNFNPANQRHMLDPNAVALAVMLLAVRDAEIRDASLTNQGPSASVFSTDEVDAKPGQVISRLVDSLIGVFSTKDEVARSDIAKKLTRLIGRKEANQLMASFPEIYFEPDVQKELLLIEVDRINRCRLHIDGLRDCDLSSIANDSSIDEGTPLENAVAWILKNSNSESANNTVDFFQIITSYVQGNQDLTDHRIVDEIHARLVPQMDWESRHIIPNVRTLTPVSGKKMFDIHLQKLRAEPVDADDLEDHLFAGIIGYHPYPDGNGRTARAVYAIGKLRKQAFQPLSIPREDALSGLPEEHQTFRKRGRVT
jgi:hypothetical protein